ncbi:Phosphate-binding protein PstS precursor, partial [Haemophilus influenzae]
IYTALYTKPST